MAVYHPSPFLTQIYTNPQKKEDIKDAGRDLKTSTGCSKCHRLESSHVKLMKCAKCKFALYCSKKCQTEHWPSHKAECKLSTDYNLHALADLIHYFLGNEFLHVYLEVAMILELGLECATPALDRFFSAQFYVGIEPCDICDFRRVWSPYFRFDPSKKIKMNGMFQLLGLTTSSAQPPSRDVPSMPWNLKTRNFADLRRKCDEAGHPLDPLVSCELIGIADGSTYGDLTCISLSENAFMLAESMKTITVSEGIHKPLTVATCLEFINMHIRHDTQNRFYLRSMMKMGDIRFINYTRIDMDSVKPFVIQAKKALQGKVKRESVYVE